MPIEIKDGAYVINLHEYAKLALIGLLSMLQGCPAMLLISKILVLNTLLNTFIIFSIGNNSIVTINSEFNHIIQSCADIFALDLLTIFLHVRVINYTNMFSPYDFKKSSLINLNYVKMGESLNIYPNVSNQTQFRPKKINKIKDYFTTGICKRETVNK